ncbi:translation initiation factor IF-2 N-terminal domain-containing protein [Marinoscillum furvescens]|uniref:Translation initiation factor IF-2-like protein n=1 Tax=Marinoscillum furvescens DSM 4134 TaxID=1122208 RepID=A0A3D9L1U3_MARFU|nr:translation initiation factor IF-2 N-terminal domain-containing protein [Marinoscillum furvescens]RED94895.1 translation initiation factor IF-2-like protein [Marinoscillum furvescens DSM 4134]
MRLGQLARKLDVSTTDIIAFLKTKGIEKNDHPNVKLDDEIEQEVIAHFGEEQEEPLPDASPTSEDPTDEAPTPKEVAATPPNAEDDLTSAVESEEATETPTPTATLSEEATATNPNIEIANDDRGEPAIAEETEPAQDETIAGVQDEQDDEAERNYESVDVIKAPKVELPGLKVVGKIDLPEPKPKEETPKEEEAPKEEKEETPKVRYAYHDRRNSRKKLTPEEREARRLKNKKAKEKRLAREAEKRKERELKRIKAKKAEHYKKKLEQKAVSPKIKTQKATAPKKRKKQEPKQPQPKTLLGKFWRWLNT